jgi:hypothetical protein
MLAQCSAIHTLGYKFIQQQRKQTVPDSADTTLSAPSNRSFPGGKIQKMHWPARLTASAVACIVFEPPTQR